MPSIYLPHSAAIGCDVSLFEAYFGYKAKGTEEPGAGAFKSGLFPHSGSFTTLVVLNALRRDRESLIDLDHL